MRFTPIVLVLAVVSLAFAVSGQTRTITNTDLEKYKERRLAAERDLRENYAKMGFLSPEEQAREDERAMREREDLVSRLRTERIEREQAEAARRQANNAELQQVIIVENGTGRIVGFGYSGHFRHRGSPRGGRASLPVSDWRATPGGIIYEPGGRSSSVYSPVRQRPRPAFQTRGSRPRR